MNENKDEHNNKKISRKRFFRELLKEFSDPIVSYLDAKVRKITGEIIRPPGAGIEIQFMSLCNKCYSCVKICPAYAIRVYHIKPDQNEDPNLEGFPYIDPVKQPCLMCNDILCSKVCPTGALQKIDEANKIRMGIAIINDNCLRTKGVLCSECVNKCLLGSEVISINSNNQSINIDLGKCTGCGICAYYCPAIPKAITIEKAI